MLGIHRKVRRVALIAAAVVAGSLSAKSASASTLYNTNFDSYYDYNSSPTSSTFTTGTNNADGQDSLQESGNGGDSSATITNPGSNNPGYLTMSRETGDNFAVGPNNIAYSSAAPFTVDSVVTVTLPATYTTSTGNSEGPVFGLNVLGNGSTVPIASLVVSAGNGDVWDTADDDYEANGLVANFAAGSSIKLEIDATFSGGEVSLNYLVNNALVDGTSQGVPLVSASSFSLAEMFGGIAVDGNGSDTAPDTLTSVTFSGFSVTESVPEPTSLAALCVGGVLFGLRRNRRPLSVG